MKIDPNLVYLFPWAPGGNWDLFSVGEEVVELHCRRVFGTGTNDIYCHVFRYKHERVWRSSYELRAYPTKEEAMAARDKLFNSSKNEFYLIPENEAEKFRRLELLI